MVRTMNNLNAKIEELLTVLKKKTDDDQQNRVRCVLATIGKGAAVTAIAMAGDFRFASDYLQDIDTVF